MLLKYFLLLVIIGRGGCYLGLLALTTFFSSLMTTWFSILRANYAQYHLLHGDSLGLVLAATISSGLVCSLWFVMRPIRRVVLLAACKLMIHSGMGLPLRFGVWELLRIGEWTALHRTCRFVNRSKRSEIEGIVSKLEHWPACPVASEPGMFLAVIGH